MARSWAEANLGELAEQFAQGILEQQPLAATIAGGDLTAEVMDKVSLTFSLPRRVDDTTFRVPVTLTLEEEYEAPILGNVNVMASQTLGVGIDILVGEVTGLDVLAALTITLDGDSAIEVPPQQVPDTPPSSLTPDEALELARAWADENLSELAEQFAQGVLEQYPIASTVIGGDLTAEVVDKVTLTFGLPDLVEGTTFRVPVTLTLEEEYDAPIIGSVQVAVTQTLSLDIDIQAREVTGWDVLVALDVQLG